MRDLSGSELQSIYFDHRQMTRDCQCLDCYNYQRQQRANAEAAELTRLRAIEAAAMEVAKAVPFGCDRIRELAFDLPAPNEKTPQLMGIAIELTRLAEKLRLALSGGEGK